MSYEPYKGATLLVPSGPSGMHLFVVVTNKCSHGFHMMVSITSIHAGRNYDDACVFTGGEHPFIIRPSYVYYRLAEQKSAKAIVAGVASGLFIPRDDLELEHLEKVCAGFDASDFCAGWALEYYEENKNN